MSSRPLAETGRITNAMIKYTAFKVFDRPGLPGKEVVLISRAEHFALWAHSLSLAQ